MPNCKACGKEIVFLKSSKGKMVPVNADTASPGDTHFYPKKGHVSHFSDCPQAELFRKAEKVK